MTTINRQWLLSSRPKGEANVDNFRLVETPVSELNDGEVLVRHIFMSLDPYMRGRMNESKNYAQPQPLDKVMSGRTAGEVVASKHASFAVGDQVVSMGGWQEYSIADGNLHGALQKVDTTHIPLSAYLGTVGMPGATAWYGLTKIIDAKAGETVVVSASSGAVGSVVGQLAKVRGCRVVGLAGGAEKCDYVVEQLGFDACIDYRRHFDVTTLSAALKEACPDGIDGYFENVGGITLDAVLQNMNVFGRIAVCGMIAGYNDEPIPLMQPQLILQSRLKVEGFISGEHMEVWPDALKEIGGLVASGKIKYRETIAQGILSAPEAFIDVLKGRNFGKQLVKLV